MAWHLVRLPCWRPAVIAARSRDATTIDTTCEEDIRMEQTGAYDHFGSTDVAEDWPAPLPGIDSAPSGWRVAPVGRRGAPPAPSFAWIEALVRDLPPMEEL